MYRFRLNARSHAGGIERILLFGLSWLLAASVWPLTATASAPVKNSAASALAASRPDPEKFLLEIYRDLAANHLRAAQAKADALVQAYPNFRLGHLIRGDVLLMHTHQVTTLGAVGGAEEKLGNLRAEAMVRLKSLRERPDPDLVPRSILQLREDQKHVLVVDAKRSRLYVYEHRAGQLTFLKDYYISQGKLGVDKFKAGDQKTPLGVYYITSRLPGARLPDFYGTGALPINYPNDWDKRNGRSGSGIWLHGTPSDSYSRPPLSSDGCVVLTNPDLSQLYDSIEVGKTPVVISDGVEFVNKTKWNNDRNVAIRLTDAWRRDLQSMSASRLLAHYSRQFKSEHGEDLATWFAKQQQTLNGIKTAIVTLSDVTFFLYPGQTDMIVGTFTEDVLIGKNRNSIRKRQYWVKEGAQWKIISEITL